MDRPSERGSAGVKPIPLWPALRADLLEYAGRGGVWSLARTVVFASSFHAALLYRVAHTARARFGLMGRVLAGFLVWFSSRWYGCTISHRARIEGGLVMVHPHGIVIGHEVVIGPRAWIFQNVTIGATSERAGMPAIGADAHIYSGAVVVGPIRIGDDVHIGANCVVWQDVPDHTRVRPPRPELFAR
jgi:serine O-acetyltransferase